MKIALDWDETWTRDGPFWATVVAIAHKAGHHVRIVTFRYPHHCQDIYHELEQYGLAGVPIIATGHNQKRAYCAQQEDFLPDVWIDDTPEYIVGTNSLDSPSN